MLFLKVAHKDAKQVQQALLDAGALDTRTKVERDDLFTYFPVLRVLEGYEYVKREGRETRRPKDLQAALEPILTPSERAELIASYDLLGNVAIVDIPEQLVSKEQQIASAVMETHNQVTTVLKKSHKHHGEFRTQKLAFLAGEDTKEALVIESGCKILVDVEQVYFSVRLSTERLRIASAITPGERVLVMFSGAAPYVVVLAKHSVASAVIGVEKNPVGHRYAVENLRLNKLTNARVYNADCIDLTFLDEEYDRIIMPLPASSEQFVSAALQAAKNRCTLHVYKFGKEGELPAIEGQLRELCETSGFKVERVEIVKAGHHAPFVYRWCFDVVVLRH